MIILWASILAFLPIVASSSIQVCRSVGLVGKGGILGVWSDCSDIISGSLGRWAKNIGMWLGWLYEWYGVVLVTVFISFVVF